MGLRGRILSLVNSRGGLDHAASNYAQDRRTSPTRDRLGWSAVPSPDSKSEQPIVTSDESVDGLAFQFQREIAIVEKGAMLLPGRHRIVIHSLKGSTPMSIRIRYSH